MNFIIPNDAKNIFVLGAGSSVEYGLPVWNELGLRMKEKINNDQTNSYKYKKQILKWIDKVGEDKQYKTLDECIFNESVSLEHHTDGVEVENEIFSIIKDIFSDLYRKENGVWIKNLNQKILENTTLRLEQQITFINYNYDQVLEDNLLDYEYLPTKHRRLSYKPRLDSLSNFVIRTLYPHGTLFPEVGN